MFRFIHTADVHLDSPLEGLESYEGAPVETLRGATRRALQNLVRLALDEDVDFVVIAGDLYDGDWKDFSTGLFFTREMNRLSEAGIDVILIAGNHDAASVLTRRLSLPPRVRLLSSREAETALLADLPVAVHGRGFPSRAVPENFVPDYPERIPDCFNMGLLHTSLNGLPGHDRYAPCSVSDLIRKDYHYWALGHVHQRQIVHQNPWIVYPGNLQGRHVRECGPRGCQLVTVDELLRVVQTEFCALDVVRWALVDVDLTEAAHEDDLLLRTVDAIRAAVRDADGRLLAARITFTGATSLHGRLKRELPRLRAECISQGHQTAGDNLWIEDVIVRTVPLHDLAELSERDDLTRIVIESLQAAAVGALTVPTGIAEMLKALPPELKPEIEADLSPERRELLLDDVRSILIEALSAGAEEP